MKHAQAVETFVKQFGKGGLFIVRFANEASLLSENPQAFGIVYENDHTDESVQKLMREMRASAVEKGVVHVQNTVCHKEWPGKLHNEADVVLVHQRIDNQLYLVADKWRGETPTLKSIPIDEL